MRKQSLKLMLAVSISAIMPLLGTAGHTQQTIKNPPGPHKTLDLEQVKQAKAESARLINLPEQQELRKEVLELTRKFKLNAPTHPLSMQMRPIVVDHTAQQTPIRNQQNRGTCTEHAVVAALEAAYKRSGAGSFDIAEEYLIWLRNETVLATDLAATDTVHRESLPGYCSGGGTGGLLDLLKEYRLCAEADRPYQNDDPPASYLSSFGLSNFRWDDAGVTQTAVNSYNCAPQQLPPATRRGLLYGIRDYVTLTPEQVHDPETMELILAAGYDICLNLNVYWDPPIHTPTGDIPVWVKQPGSPLGGGHAILLVGYDRARHFFIVKNSWGPAHYDASHLQPAYRDVTRYEGFTLLDYNYLNEAFAAEYIKFVVPASYTFQSLRQRLLGQWDVHLRRTDTQQEVASGALYWRRIPGTDVNHADRRIGDIMFADRRQILRVNGDPMRAEFHGYSMYLNFDPTATPVTGEVGLRVRGDFTDPANPDACTFKGRFDIAGGATPMVYGVPADKLELIATRH